MHLPGPFVYRPKNVKNIAFVLCVIPRPRDRALKIESVRRGRGTLCFVSFCIVLMFCNEPMGCGSGEYCTVFSLPITTVTKSLGLGGVEVQAGAGVRVVSGTVGQRELNGKKNVSTYVKIHQKVKVLQILHGVFLLCLLTGSDRHK